MKPTRVKTLGLAAIAAAVTVSLGQVVLAERGSTTTDEASEVQLVNGGPEQIYDIASDSWITAQVKSALLAQDPLTGYEISVSTKQGVVSLRGIVPSAVERDLAFNAAKAIQGVLQVSANALKTVE